MKASHPHASRWARSSRPLIQASTAGLANVHLIVMPYGDHYVMGGERSAECVSILALLDSPAVGGDAGASPWWWWPAY